MNTPLIFFNDNLVSANFRGMRRYFTELIRRAMTRFGDDMFVYAPQQKTLSSARHIQAFVIHGQQPLRMNQVIVSLLVRAVRPKILFNAYYTDVCAPEYELFTVYDMIPELMPQHFSQKEHGNRNFIAQKQRSIERAAIIFTISISTARDLIEIYPHLDASRIVITPLGVDATFFEAPQSLNIQNRPYFLFVGHRARYKNFLRLLKAFTESGLSTQYDLVVLSPGDFQPDEQDIIQNLRLVSSVRIITSATDILLKAYYHHAVALVYPSEYEGFGLPILEAMACGTLVATSNTSSMPEVGGTVAFYFDPFSVPSIAQILVEIAHLDKDKRQQRILQGISHAKTFTWDRCAQQTFDAIQTLL